MNKIILFFLPISLNAQIGMEWEGDESYYTNNDGSEITRWITAGFLLLLIILLIWLWSKTKRK